MADSAVATPVPLPALATFVDHLSYPSDVTIGQQHRVAFHEKDYRDVKQTIQGEDLLAFLSFEKSTVAYRVLLNMAPSNDDFPAIAQAYADWVRKFGGWAWGAEHALYKDLCPRDVGTPAYTWPKCEIVEAKAPEQVDNGDGTAQVTIEVNGQGFLPGASVAVYNYPGSDRTPVAQDKATLADCSTFRYGRLGLTVKLGKGKKYRTEVINDLGTDEQGKPLYQTIADPVLGVFEVTA